MNFYKCLKNQILTHGEYSLVPIRFEDRFNIMKWRNEQIYHLRQAEPLTEENQERYFNNVIIKLFDKDKPDQILFSFLKNEECIGYGGMVHINWIDQNAELSFLIKTELEKEHFVNFWTIYLALIENVAFRQLHLHKIYTYSFDLRPKLYDALDSAGFKQEARLNEHVIFQGKAIDVLINSKINKHIGLLPASANDTDRTFLWASNPIIRKYSFNQDKITFEHHKKWFLNKLNNPLCHYFILQRGAEKIGSIRVDIDDNKQEGLISYLIDPLFHGHGFGTLILESIEDEIKKYYPKLILKGMVIDSNKPSISIFKKLHYVKESQTNNVITYTKKIGK